ncbi:relaxase/mobilization nuclease domain-containing protein [Alicyclobacillus ferrooxydans]|uniref:MobA/VirD2-like nuclease domain-containing protein n=1 Tax=Alicyclobacillus ferrooxydans TaxID=471514 RepID=A0A0P9EIN6_9BACL|nr:hypothetical protein [Alicyclobacillus ferrooxydans]KPV42683.1 hypothetical protein AN477_16250 [Alicyclobacillus ferrooxydans]
MAEARVFVKHQRRNSVQGARQYTKYIGFRARERADEERGFFNERFDRGADFETFITKIETHPALQHGATVKMHALIVSMRGRDYDSFIENGGNYKEFARAFMRDLEERKGMKLEWIAAVHEKTGHPHVHIHIMGVGATPDGKSKRVYLNKTDYEWSRDILAQKLDAIAPQRDFHQRVPGTRRTHEPTPERTMEQTLRSIGRDTSSDASTTAHAVKGNRRRRARRDQQQKQIARETDRELDR